MTESRLTAIRADPGRRRIAVLAAGAFGVGLASLHWLGIVAAGALVGVFAPTTRRALLWGVGVAVVVLATFFVQTLAAGTLDRVVGAGQPFLVSVVVPFVAAPLGALVRALE